MLLALLYVLWLFLQSSFQPASLKKISVPGAGWYDMACLGYGSYVDNVMTAVFAILLCRIRKVTAQLEFSGKGAIL